MKDKINKPFFFALLVFLSSGNAAQVLPHETQNEVDVFKRNSEPFVEEFDVIPKQHSLVLNFGGPLTDNFSNDFSYYFVGFIFLVGMYLKYRCV